VDDDFVHDQFGSSCTLDPNFAPMTADLNSDGIDDLVLVGHCKNPLIDQDEKNYKVIDPMNSYFGYGNPKITSSMGPADPRLKGIVLLVIHGAGSEAWRSATPPTTSGRSTAPASPAPPSGSTSLSSGTSAGRRA